MLMKMSRYLFNLSQSAQQNLKSSSMQKLPFLALTQNMFKKTEFLLTEAKFY